MEKWNEQKDTNMFLSDAHAHIGTKAEWEERVKYPIPTCISAGNPQEAKALESLLRTASEGEIFIPTYGLHPWYADLQTLESMLPFLSRGRMVGEIGMDSEWCKVPLSIQKEVFERQLEFAVKNKKPVVLHTKGQEKEIAQIIGDYPNTYLVHWYSAENYLEDYILKDCYFSIGPDVCWNSAVQKVAELVPCNRILIETDGLGAVQWAYEQGALPTEPVSVAKSLYNTLACVAKLRRADTKELSMMVKRNFLKLSNLDV